MAACLQPQFRTERAGWACAQSRLPPVRFSWSSVFYSAAPILASCGGTGFAPNPGLAGSRKLSVPGRVHSIPKSCGSQAALTLAGSNPFLTHGTVESPAKLFLHRFSEFGRAAASNQTIGFCVQPLSWLAAALKICLFVHDCFSGVPPPPIS